MRRLKRFSLTLILLAGAIPGLFWQIIDPLLGINTFGIDHVNTPFQMIMKGIPSTLVSWLSVYILYKWMFPFFVKEESDRSEKLALNAVSVFFLSNIGFTLSWLVLEVVSIAYNWTTLAYVDLLGGIVIMFIWGLVPATICAVLIFVLGLTIRDLK